MWVRARKRSTDGMRQPLARPVLEPMPSDGVVVDEVDHYRSRASWSGNIQSNAINPGPGKIEEVAVSNGVGDFHGSKGFSGNSKPGLRDFFHYSRVSDAFAGDRVEYSHDQVMVVSSRGLDAVCGIPDDPLCDCGWHQPEIHGETMACNALGRFLGERRRADGALDQQHRNKGGDHAPEISPALALELHCFSDQLPSARPCLGPPIRSPRRGMKPGTSRI